MNIKRFFVAGVLMGSALCLFFYNEAHIKIVDTADIKQVTVFPEGVLTTKSKIMGKVTLSRFETVSFTTGTVIEDTLYVLNHKKYGITGERSFEVPLINLSNLGNVKKVVLIGGDIYSGEGKSRGISESDYPLIEDSRLVWEMK